MARWVVGSIPYGEPTELFLVSASAVIVASKRISISPAKIDEIIICMTGSDLRPITHQLYLFKVQGRCPGHTPQLSGLSD